ncbi:hypothetical protein K490DRAFT_61990 [Saccharata proteae CBS 121410]|uniref:Rhodopsin domain-containing protein n=1 Tax=Saccharata proteae CBS 121410 TaxID=1314787 RepID=A0A9P4I001_9PEZI|nr:hypothetical protein K490DRAFT_61990 [Saccharata proteae CBS 121410]
MEAYATKPIHTFAGHGNGVFIINVVGIIILWAALFLRLYVRIGVLKIRLDVDDYMMIVCILSFTWMAIAMILLVYFGFGQHISSVPISELIQAFKIYLHGELGYIAAVLFFKLSVSFFYLRITNLKWQRKIIYVLAVVNVLYSTGYFILLIFQCTPVSYLWTRFVGGKGTCLSNDVVINTSYAHNAMSLVSDWTLAILPIFLIKGSSLNLRTKVIVILLLGLGAFASIASLIRMTKLRALSDSLDYTYTSIPIIFWSALEAVISILVANLATYRPLFQSLIKTVTKPASKNSSSGPNRFSMRWSRRNRQRRSGSGYILSGMGNDITKSSDTKSTPDRNIEAQSVVVESDTKYANSNSEMSDEEMGITRQTDITMTESFDTNRP